jgi:hypothetical protein
MLRSAIVLSVFLLSVSMASTNPSPSRSTARCASIPDSVTLRNRVTRGLLGSPAVLSGEATEVGIILSNDSIHSVHDTTVDGPIGARVVTTRWWKGPAEHTILVAWQPSRDLMVSEVYPLVKGQRYVLFLSREGRHYWSWGCGGSSGGLRADSVASVLDSLSG